VSKWAIRYLIILRGATVEDIGLPRAIKEDIHKFQMQGFAEEHFRKHKKRQGIFKRRTLVGDVLSFQKEPIVTSLLKISKDNTAAVNVFKNVLRFMGLLDSSKFSPSAIAKQVAETGVENPELRDEIYCQLCKQTRANPDVVSNMLAWKLFALCSCVFAPTRGFESYLLSYMSQNCHGSPDLVSLIIFCIWRVNRTMRFGPMKQPLTLPQIDEVAEDGIPFKYVSFGCSLRLLMKCQENASVESPVPVVLRNLTDACIAAGGLKTTGIFRRTGDKSMIDALVASLETGNLEAKSDDPLVLADVIKIWFREMYPRILSSEASKLAMSVSDKPDKYPAVLGMLDSYQMAALDHLLHFAALISKNSVVTR